MIILGLNCLAPSPVVHDVTSALIIDGELCSSVTEDRFTRIKHYNGFPSMGIKYCLEKEGIRLSDVDRIAVGYGLYSNKTNPTLRSEFHAFAEPLSGFRNTPFRSKNPIFYDHEYIHAKTGFYFSGFKKALAIVLDGGGNDRGQYVSGGIFLIDNGSTEVLKLYPQEASLGWTFGAFTEICGFRMTDGEGKTMSLAAFGENEKPEIKEQVYQDVKKIFPKYDGINYIEGGIKHPSWHLEHNSGFVHFDDPRLLALPEKYSKEVIAWAAQKVLEETIIDISNAAIDYSGIKDIIFSGGIFLNMIANMMIKENLETRHCRLFVNPVCGDVGNALGAAMEEYFRETGKYSSWKEPHLSLGPEYDEKQIESSLERMNFNYKKVDKVSTAVDLIDRGLSVGWFQGRTELGPRGLGNRSILSKTNDIKFKDLINEKVKHRESWRPFCPTIIDTKSDYYLENCSYAPYMIMGARMKHSEEVPAVVHIDNTTRPQILTRTYNPEFYDVIQDVGGIVLNTSLNLAGNPIDLTPDDALMTFKYSEMDAIILGNFLIER